MTIAQRRQCICPPAGLLSTNTVEIRSLAHDSITKLDYRHAYCSRSGNKLWYPYDDHLDGHAASQYTPINVRISVAPFWPKHNSAICSATSTVHRLCTVITSFVAHLITQSILLCFLLLGKDILIALCEPNGALANAPGSIGCLPCPFCPRLSSMVCSSKLARLG
jgi:hypothetical protein